MILDQKALEAARDALKVALNRQGVLFTDGTCEKLLLSALAAIPPSEPGRFEIAKGAEVDILREYELGNLTPLGVANHLRRAGFNLKYATDKANSLAHPPAAAREEVIEQLQEAVDLLAERRYGSPARSPGHNARLVVERVIRAISSEPHHG